nr:FimV/HubP family polar landmark protein [uncultured Halomonas sp.]
MRRTLSLAMLISLVTASPAAQALGLADPRVQSSLNEPLEARVDITDLRGLDPTLLKVRLADEAAFEQAGLPRSTLAESVQMALERGAGGLQLVLTTERVIREPYLDLLVTLYWPNGQQRGQITLLFDPPGYASAPALIDNAPMSASPRQPQIDAVPLVSQRQEAVPAISSSDSTASSSVRVHSGDTLWGLARRVRPGEDVSIEQVMLALLQANPDAFPDGNINGLRAGAVLAVPPRQAMSASTAAEATSRVQAQNRAWRSDDSAQRSVAAQPETNVTPEPSLPESQPAEAPSDAGPRLTLLSDADLAAERAARMAGTPDTPPTESVPDRRLDQLTAQWQASREALASSREARERLEKEIATLRQDVAELREMLLAAAPDPAEPEPVPVTEPEPVTARAAAAPAGPSLSALPASGGSAGDAEDRGVWRILSDNLLAIAALAIALLLSLWVVVRRRNADGRGHAGVSFPLGAGSIAGGEVVSPATASAPVASPASSQPATSRADELPSAAPQADVPRASAPQTETETINEADVFIAYGRYDRARELLRQSLDSDPERHDLRLKLLSVHVELGEREEAECEAARLEALDEPDNQRYRQEARQLMHRFGGTYGCEDADDGDCDVSGGAVDSTAEPQAPEEDDTQASCSDALDDDPAPVGGTNTTSEGYIEYEPPYLDPITADDSARKHDKHHAALHQPGIDYPGSLASVDDDADELEVSIAVSEEIPPRSATIEHDWEIEEVAFEPLNLDNEPSTVGASQASPEQLLDRARERLDEGEQDAARDLLHGLLEHNDTHVVEEARLIIERHNLY